MFTKNLDGWEKARRTDSCSLDGAYFNKIFSEYPGLLKNPLNIRIRKGRNGVRKYAHMEQNQINTDYPGLLRVNIEANNFRHSNLLILDYENGIAHRFEPLGKNAPHFQEVNDAIDDYLNAFFDFDIEVIDADFSKEMKCGLNEKNEKCDNSGFCVAYVILYAYCYLRNQPFPCTEIRRFASKIEQTYGKIPVNEQEVQYGPYHDHHDDNRGGKMLAGAGIGALGGLALGIPVAGALGGLAVGAVL